MLIFFKETVREVQVARCPFSGLDPEPKVEPAPETCQVLVKPETQPVTQISPVKADGRMKEEVEQAEYYEVGNIKILYMVSCFESI